MEDYTITKKNSPKLEEFNSSLKFKLKLPKHEQDLATSSHQNVNRSIQLAQLKEEIDDELEEGEFRVAPSSPTPPSPICGDVDDKVKLRICHYCNKGFSNGKALGGHMRIHAINYNNKSNKKLTPNQNDVLNNNNNNQDVFKCTLCPKQFPSDKSLFGHMRSHPDRLWRGMNPPRQLAAYNMAASDVEESSIMAEDRPSSLGTWSVKGKRGRMGYSSSLSPVTSTSSASFRSNDVMAADLMLLLAGGGGDKGENESESDDVGYETKKAKKGKGLMVDEKLFDDDEVYYLKNLGFLPNYKLDDDDDNKMKTINKFDDDNELIKVASLSSTPSKIKGANKKIIGKNNHKIKNDNCDYMENNHINHDEINNYNKWVCTTCGKSFPTHQALGGHRSSHNKDKYNNNNNTTSVQTRVIDALGLTNTDPIIGNNNKGDNGGDEGQAEVVVSDGVVTTNCVHECKICDKTFASGQALGGHQRCHYVNGSSDFSSSPSSGQTSRRVHLDLFDLNVVPPMMDDDDTGDVTFDSISNQYGSS